MHFLLDTHTLIWWMSNSPLLPAKVRRLIQQRTNLIFVSATSAWEMATKIRLGRLPTNLVVTQDFEQYLEQSGFEGLPMTLAHGIRAGMLPGPQRDPFDRMLIAQAQAEGLALVSNEEGFDQYGIERIW